MKPTHPSPGSGAPGGRAALRPPFGAAQGPQPLCQPPLSTTAGGLAPRGHLPPPARCSPGHGGPPARPSPPAGRIPVGRPLRSRPGAPLAPRPGSARLVPARLGLARLDSAWLGSSPEIPGLCSPRVLRHPRVLSPGLQGGCSGPRRGRSPPSRPPPPRRTGGATGVPPAARPRLLYPHCVGTAGSTARQRGGQFSNSQAACVKVTNIY